jgi:anti-anti-sigma factor
MADYFFTNFEMHERGGVKVLVLSKNVVDDTFQQDVDSALVDGGDRVVIDFRNVELFLCAAWPTLLALGMRKGRRPGFRLILCSLPDCVRRMLDVTNLDGFFEEAEDVEEALRRLAGPEAVSPED